MALGFTFTAGWGALLTAVVAVVGPLAGVALTQRSNRTAERERSSAAAAERAADREHELQRTDAQVRAERRARLYADRRSAYAACRRAFVHYRRAEANASLALHRIKEFNPNTQADESRDAQLKFDEVADPGHRCRE